MDANAERDRGTTKTSGCFSLMPFLRQGVEAAVLSAAATASSASGYLSSCTTITTDIVPSVGIVDAAPARQSQTVGGSGVDWLNLSELLSLHHLLVATQASVAEHKASIRVPREIGMNGSAYDSDDSDENDYESKGDGEFRQQPWCGAGQSFMMAVDGSKDSCLIAQGFCAARHERQFRPSCAETRYSFLLMSSTLRRSHGDDATAWGGVGLPPGTLPLLGRALDNHYR